MLRERIRHNNISFGRKYLKFKWIQENKLGAIAVQSQQSSVLFKKSSQKSKLDRSNVSPIENGQDEYKLDQNSENMSENPLSSQNLVEGRVSRVELLLAAVKRQEEQRRIELEREQLERERRNDRWRKEDREI